MNSELSEIQENTISGYNNSRICSFDVEFIERPTKPLFHQMARFLYFYAGEGRIKINGKVYEIRANTIIAILPWETSEIVKVTEPLKFYKIIYDVDVVAQAIHSWYTWEHKPMSFQTALEEHAAGYLDEKESEACSRIAADLREELGVESCYNSPPERKFSGIFVVSKLVELIVRHLRAASQSRENGSLGIAETEPDNCAQIFRYCYAHLSEHLTLEKLSAALYMSKSSISKYIASTTGQSFSEILSGMRLAKASELLTHTEMTLEQVAQLCGFTDAPHVSKAFAARMGHTTSEYRKAARADLNIFTEAEKRTAYDIIGYVYKNYTDSELNIMAVTTQFHLPAKEINRVLLLHLEKNFDEFLHYLRINRACEYLLCTRMSIIDIAVEVGYNNVKTFNRNFVRLQKMTPGDFRQSTTLQIGGETIVKE